MKIYLTISLLSFVVICCSTKEDTPPSIDTKVFNESEKAVIDSFIHQFDKYVLNRYNSSELIEAYRMLVTEYRNSVMESGFEFHIGKDTVSRFMRIHDNLPEGTLWTIDALEYRRTLPTVDRSDYFPDSVMINVNTTRTRLAEFLKEQANTNQDIREYYFLGRKYGPNSIQEFNFMFHNDSIFDMTLPEARLMYALYLIRYFDAGFKYEGSYETLLKDVEKQLRKRRGE